MPSALTLTGGDELTAGSGVEVGDGVAVGGEHEGAPAGVDVGLPGGEQLVEQVAARPAGHAVVSQVGIDGCGVADAEPKACLALPCVGEAVHVEELRGVPSGVGEEPERSSGLHRRQLGPVPHQQHLRPRLRGSAVM